MTTSSGDSILCPSHRCKPGSMLLGVREESGHVAILPQPLPVDEAFVARAKSGEVPPEQRFRFTNKCIEGGCNQWSGTGCGIAERVVQLLEMLPAEAGSSVVPCGIRDRCRWHLQRGNAACAVCPYVITELTEEEVLAAVV